MDNKYLGFGAHPSVIDGNELKSHIDFPVKAVIPAPSFSIPFDFHLNQNQIGICTAISLATMMQKAWGIPFSPQFIYNVGKKMFDGNTDEGSSIKTMLRVLNKYGAAPLSLVPNDNTLRPYASYVQDWFSPAVFAEALKYKMNYATARLDPVGFAIDLMNSQYGINKRIAVGDEWYTNAQGQIDYSVKGLEPLRAPNPATGGHASMDNEYVGLDENQYRTDHNTWGDKNNQLPFAPPLNVWCDNGDIHYYYKTMKPYITEAWTISKPIPTAPIGFIFKNDLQLGDNNDDVKHLQVYLNNHGFPIATTGAGSSGKETSYFGLLTKKALMAFQVAKNLTPAVGFCGPKTRLFISTNQ